MELSLVTCNIRFSNPADGPNSWEHRRDFLAEILRSHRPDIIATQEGRFDQLKDLENLLKDYDIIDQHRSWIKERMYPSIFLKKNKFEVRKSEDLWLSTTPHIAGSISFNSTFPRLMTWVSVQPKNYHKNILVVNTHLDHLKRETREEQAKVLAREIGHIRTDENVLALLGDFNDSPGSSVQSIIKNSVAGLIDAWTDLNHPEEASHHSFKGSFPEGARIDWILIEGDARINECWMEKTSRADLFPSDHFPIVCKITL
jgi:endonuclease/exonuclease/phosphatase family metal-dependent hydrolase